MKYKKIAFSNLVDSYTGSPNVSNQIISICKSRCISLSIYSGNKASGGLISDHHKNEISRYVFLKNSKKLIQFLTFFIPSYSFLKIT